MGVINWGLLGAGDIVRKRVLPAMLSLENCHPLAVTRGRSDRAEEFAAANGIERAYTSLGEMLADSDVHAVYIASPVHLHAEHAIAAAVAGKHILCEKPMALTAGECREMIAAADSNGVTLGVAYYRRFYPVVRRIKQLIDAGEIGRPVIVHISTFERFDPAPDDPRRWFIEKEKSGGGPMMDFGCHRIEVLLNLFGPVERVESLNSNVLYERNVEDTSAALMKFASGPTATLTVTHAAADSRDSVDIFGTEGAIHVANLNAGEVVIHGRSGSNTEKHPPARNFHEPLIRDFAEAVLAGRQPVVTGAVGLDVALIEDRIYGRK